MENKEKEKYYTPSIEEFHVGFECETIDKDACMEEFGKEQDFRVCFNEIYVPKKIWKSVVFDDKMCSRIEFYKLNTSWLESDFRVKYLDREDIESFGFKKRLKDEWIGWKDYALDTISGEIPYFLSATIHIPIMDDCYKIYLHRYLDDDTKLETRINEGESELVYKGTIKNKSELSRLLKQLSII